MKHSPEKTRGRGEGAYGKHLHNGSLAIDLQHLASPDSAVTEL